jgi:hypothetical protein
MNLTRLMVLGTLAAHGPRHGLTRAFTSRKRTAEAVRGMDLAHVFVRDNA